MPFVETVFFQSFVIEATAWVGTRLIGKDREGILLVLGGLLSAAMFIAAHLVMNGLFNAVVFSIVGGFAFSTIYLVNRKNGKQEALASTWLLHLATNAFFMLAFAFFARLFA